MSAPLLHLRGSAGTTSDGVPRKGVSTMQRIERQGVQGASYDDTTQTLRIVFARGAEYEYYEVPRAVFEWLCRSAEPGGYVQRILTPRYRYRAVKGVRPETAEQDLIATLQASIERLAQAQLAKSSGNEDDSAKVPAR
jgi:KTSC domain